MPLKTFHDSDTSLIAPPTPDDLDTHGHANAPPHVFLDCLGQQVIHAILIGRRDICCGDMSEGEAATGSLKQTPQDLIV